MLQKDITNKLSVFIYSRDWRPKVFYFTNRMRFF